MILRIVLGRLPVGTDARAVLDVRDRLTAAARGVHGLDSLIVGTRRAGIEAPDDRIEAAIVTVWSDVDRMMRATAVDEADRFLDARLQVPIEIDRADHYEIIGRTFAALPSAATALLRIIRVRAHPNGDAHLFETLRDQQPRLVELGLVASHIGRRVVESGIEAVTVGVWPDRRTIRAATGGGPERPIFASELDPWSDDLTLEMYDGIEIAPRLPSLSGPPLMFLDDALRIVDATASAAATLGWATEDLVGRSLSELSITDRDTFRANRDRLFGGGAVIGEGTLLVPDAGRVFIRYVACRDVPVEGRHAVLVRRVHEAPPTMADFDAALREAFPSTTTHD